MSMMRCARRAGALLTTTALLVTLTGSANEASASVPEHSGGATVLNTTIPPWTTYSFNPYGAAGYLSGFYGAFDYTQMALAYARLKPGKGKYGGYYRQLASGWDIKDNTITVHLRPNDKWSNGVPFSSKDVLVSMEVAGATLNSMWSSIASVTAPSAHNVVIKLKPGAVATNVLLSLTQMSIIPASQYKRFAPAGTQRNILTYWRLEDPENPTAASQAAATGSSAAKALLKIATALPKYNPPTLLADGAYKLQSISATSMLLVKWKGYWDAKDITIPKINIAALDIGEQYGAVQSGRIDFVDDTDFPDIQAEKLDATPHRKYVIIKAPISVMGLIFNQKHYPFNMLGVRKALAYIIDRQRVNKLTWGGKLIQNPTDIYTDGLANGHNPRFLTKAQLSQLNTYPRNLKKATALLEGLGFTKKRGKWYTPKGQLWKVPIFAPSGNLALFDTTAVAIVNELKQFGIQAETDIVESTTWGTDTNAGDYPVSIDGTAYGFVNPLAYFVDTLVSLQKATGAPNTAKVPGLGTVSVSGALTRELATAQPKQWPRLVWDWARYENEQLPVLHVDDNSFHLQYSSERFKDWPADSNPMWTEWGPSLITFMQHHYLKPRQ